MGTLTYEKAKEVTAFNYSCTEALGVIIKLIEDTDPDEVSDSQLIDIVATFTEKQRKAMAMMEAENDTKD